MNLDAAANLSGELLGELYVWKKDVYERDLRELGFYLGKFIYLCDSFEDVEQDIKKHNYNPLAERFKRPEFEAESRMMLVAALEVLSGKRDSRLPKKHANLPL